MATPPPDPRISQLLVALDNSFARKGWHGPTLLGSLRGVSPEAAMWLPREDAHSIWQLLLHSAYWKYAVRKQIVRESPDFPRSPSNWPAVTLDKRGRATGKAWRADVALLKEQHELLKAAVGQLDPKLLTKIPKGLKTFTYEQRILGVAAHDAYHTGQIQQLKGWWDEMQLAG